MMHPSDGVLRRALDEPEALADAQRDHVATCLRCQRALSQAREDRHLAGSVLRDADLAHVTTGDVDREWSRLTTALTEGASGSVPPGPQRRNRRRSWRRGPLLAGAGALLIVGGATAAAANDWLPVFRVTSVAPVSVPLSASALTDYSSLVDLSQLASYGHFESFTRPQLRSVADAAAARRVTGLTVAPVLNLPSGVSGSPSYRVMRQTAETFQFSAAKAGRTAARNGTSLPPLPSGLDGAVLRVTVGPAVVRLWQQGSGMPTLVVAQIGSPVAETSGVSWPVLRDALLSMPDLPPTLAQQLRAITSDGSTLPIPVPSGQFSSSATQVSGTPATLLQSNDGTFSGIIWVVDGQVHVVAGPLSPAEVTSVADALR